MLTYGQEAVLPVEVTVQSLRVRLQNNLAKEEYYEVMYANVDELGENRAIALEKLILQKDRVAKAFNKHVKYKQFEIGDLVWKTILPTSLNSEKFSKWSPTWEGPFVITEAFVGNAYRLMDIEGKEFLRDINGKYLKRYYPTMWEMREIDEEETENSE
ncbi:uncharacterized protein LOC115661436 [Syzygium oleosum]|uniref:uncharacterized protein LOC115661436 n=1 Tax=Syzygium oleosum TaxID=219896 RepID=UPI0011D200BF|nr:uncharacterized protein LOC115661436 [Syzygium oleosum]